MSRVLLTGIQPNVVAVNNNTGGTFPATLLSYTENGYTRTKNVRQQHVDHPQNAGSEY